MTSVIRGSDNFESDQLLGVNQTWQLVTRTSGVTYTNSTKRPITLVATAATSGAGTAGISATIGGVGPIVFATAQNPSSNAQCSGSIIIPPGMTYVVTFSGTTSQTVYELR